MIATKVSQLKLVKLEYETCVFLRVHDPKVFINVKTQILVNVNKFLYSLHSSILALSRARIILFKY